MSDRTDITSSDSTSPSMGVHPRILQPATFPPFDLYVRDEGADTFALFRKANEPVYANTWEKLDRGGFEMCYVRAEDSERCFDYVEENLPAILAEQALPPFQAGEWLYRIMCRATEALFSDPDSYRAYRRVRELVGQLGPMLCRHPGIEWQMADCAPLLYSMPTHSVNVSVLLVSLARNAVGVDQPDLLTEVATGGLLHDLGKTMVSPAILAKPDDLTRSEFSEIKRHPRYGLKITTPYLRHAATAQRIIGQHHENACGGGYPEGRSGDAIHIFARAARVIDVFDALTTQRPYGPALDYYRALNTMVSEMRGQFDVDILRRFIKYLGAEGKAVPPVPVQEPPNEPAPARAEPRPEPRPRRAAALMPGPIIRLGPDGDVPEPRRERPAAATAAPEPSRAEPRETRPKPRPPLAAPQAEPELAVGAPSAPAPPAGDGVRELAEEPTQDARLLSDILSALHDAFAGPFGEAMRAAAQPRPGAREAKTPLSAERQAEVEFARTLFPLVWQVDEWRNQFAAMPANAQGAARHRAEALALINGLRGALARLLEEHNVEIVETTAAEPQPAEAPADERRPHAKVGFVYRSGPGVEVLEPARLILQPDRRKAG